MASFKPAVRRKNPLPWVCQYEALCVHNNWETSSLLEAAGSNHVVSEVLPSGTRGPLPLWLWAANESSCLKPGIRRGIQMCMKVSVCTLLPLFISYFPLFSQAGVTEAATRHRCGMLPGRRPASTDSLTGNISQHVLSRNTVHCPLV